jgi:hypothetical protein
MAYPPGRRPFNPIPRRSFSLAGAGNTTTFTPGQLIRDWQASSLLQIDDLRFDVSPRTTVGSALHDQHAACPKLTALTEGTFAAVYAVIRQWIEIEIDSAKSHPSAAPDPDSMRNLAVAAYREAKSRWEELDPAEGPNDEHDDAEEPPALLGPESDDCDAWPDLLDELMDQVLWGDRDFEDEDLMLDVNPDLGPGLKAHLGIDDDYFTGVAPGPSVEELAEIRATLRKISGRPEVR